MRPIISEFRVIPEYLKAMAEWHRSVDETFSIRSRSAGLPRCSYALVSQVIHGKRKLTLDRIDSFSKIFRLTPVEKTYLRRWVDADSAPPLVLEKAKPGPKTKRKTGENHLFSDWVNPYVWEACRLNGFRADAGEIHRLLRGFVSRSHIEKSLKFLFREGYLRRTLDGRIVQNDPLVTTTDEQLDRKLQKFHRRALELAGRSIGLYPLAVRRESALVMVLNRESVGELKELMKDFYERLLAFSEEHLDDKEALFQVTLNLCPIGGNLHEN